MQYINIKNNFVTFFLKFIIDKPFTVIVDGYLLMEVYMKGFDIDLDVLEELLDIDTDILDEIDPVTVVLQ